jgi:hypothetical protein
MVWNSMVWYVVWYDVVTLGVHGMVWYGMVWYIAWYGMT